LIFSENNVLINLS